MHPYHAGIHVPVSSCIGAIGVIYHVFFVLGPPRHQHLMPGVRFNSWSLSETNPLVSAVTKL